MHPKLNQKLFLFFQATLLSIYFPPGFLCQDYATCPQPFRCGTITNISWPFSGGNRPPSCGYPGFELMNCQGGDFPLLNISSLFYRVLEIDFSAHTLRVARQDLSNTTCPTTLRNTTLNPDIFEFPPNSSDENVTLYYDCAHSNTTRQVNRFWNQFTCRVDGVTTLNLFRTGNDGSSSGPTTDITCNDKISVLVTRSAARALESITASSINVLQDALANGFLIQWSEDNAGCDCRRSGGTCVYNRNSRRIACYIETNIARSPGTVESQGEPVQSPVYPPESDGTYGDFGETVQSPDYPLEIGGFYPYGGVGYVGVILSVTGAALLIIIGIVCCIRRRCCNPKSDIDIEKFLLENGSLALKRYKYSEVKKMTKSLSDKLGQGGYGSVYKGKLRDGSLVAVKVLTETDSNGEEFINEVASISRTSHVNIVNLLGFCFDRKKRALVYEYMPNKSLDKFLGSDNLDLDKLYAIAVGVAKGLEYLHTGCNTRIVHFDIKPQNILLDEDFCPKISDFGLAKLCKKKQSLLSVIGMRGTIGYIAPEMFSRNFGGVSHKFDVYSYGMMVLEMAGANKFVDGKETMFGSSSENYFPDKIYENVIGDVTRRLDGFVIEEEEETARKMYLVGFWCIQTNPSDRPSISKVLEMLEGSLQSIQIPPKPVLFIPNTLPVLEFSSSFSSYVETEPSAEEIIRSQGVSEHC